MRTAACLRVLYETKERGEEESATGPAEGGEREGGVSERLGYECISNIAGCQTTG